MSQSAMGTKKEKKRETFICMEDFCKEKRIFSHWQILSSCVSNETEASRSLVYFCFHSDIVDVSKKCRLFFGQGHIFFFHVAQEWILPAMPL